MKTQWLILALSLAAATLGTACGGSDEGTTVIDSLWETESATTTTKLPGGEKQTTNESPTNPGIEEQGGFWAMVMTTKTWIRMIRDEEVISVPNTVGAG